MKLSKRFSNETSLYELQLVPTDAQIAYFAQEVGAPYSSEYQRPIERELLPKDFIKWKLALKRAFRYALKEALDKFEKLELTVKQIEKPTKSGQKITIETDNIETIFNLKTMPTIRKVEPKTLKKQAKLTVGTESHLDHGLSKKQIEFIKNNMKECNQFIIKTLDIPGSISCGLYGPIMGDPPVEEKDVFYAKRGGRTYESRLINKPMRFTNKVTIIAGPHEEHECYLYTAFGGPLAPQEPGDPKVRNLEESKLFWANHALVAENIKQPKKETKEAFQLSFRVKKASLAEKEIQKLFLHIIPNTPFEKKVFSVGGFERDLLMGKESKDLDIVVEIKNGAEKLAKFIKQLFPNETSEPIQLGASYPIWHIMFKDNVTYNNIEFKTANGEIDIVNFISKFSYKIL